MTDNRRIWILGATSAIAHAYARARAAQGAALLLFGRNEVRLQANAADLLARGATAVSTKCCDLVSPSDFDTLVADLMASGAPPQEVLIAYGTLEEAGRALGDIAYARDLIEINFTSVASWVLPSSGVGIAVDL